VTQIILSVGSSKKIRDSTKLIVKTLLQQKINKSKPGGLQIICNILIFGYLLNCNRGKGDYSIKVRFEKWIGAIGRNYINT